VSLRTHLKPPKITSNRVYRYVATGYEAVLNNTQYQRVLASPDVTIVALNVVVTTVAPPVKAPPGCRPFPPTPWDGSCARSRGWSA
jgi:hypothetical protein